MLRPALAGALAVVAVQAVVIGNLASDAEDDRERDRAPSSPPAWSEKGPYLKVNFKPDAREADIRLLLVEVNGSLAGGPGQLGDYYVRVPRIASTRPITAKLSTSPIVEGVAVVDGLPARRVRGARGDVSESTSRMRAACARRRWLRSRCRPWRQTAGSDSARKVALVIGNASLSRSAR